MLHIANTDIVAGSLKIGRVPGETVGWNDPLYTGPVPDGIAPAELNRLRARFLISRGWDPWHEREVREGCRRRARALAGIRRHDEVVLWFGHDLGDQLRLLQILEWLAHRELGRTRLTMVQVPDYLGSLPPEKLARLFPKRLPVTSRQLALGAVAWEAFRQPEPLRLVELLDGDTSALPFLDGALLRLLEEYPSTRNGLSRTEDRALGVIGAIGKRKGLAHVYFGTTHEGEERIFLGDTWFRSLIEDLARDPSPLVRIRRTQKRWLAWKSGLTRAGRAVHDGKADAVHLRGIDRWIGGVHLRGREAEWCWIAETLRLEHSPPPRRGRR